MKAASIPAGVPDAEIGRSAMVAPHRRPFGDLAELVKARLTLLVLFTTATGYYLGGPPSVPLSGLFHVVVGTALTAAGAAALNQWWERRLDALMNRTKGRPLPGGRMSPGVAFFTGLLLSLGGVVYLARACNLLSASLAALTVVLYVLAYTPMKMISSTNTLMGAIPGAIPPMIGWAAARNELGIGAWSLFFIMFAWQMPHFFAISWMYRADYARAGFRMLSGEDESGARSSSQSVLFCMLLLIVSGFPSYIGLTSSIYLASALALGAVFTAMAMRFHRGRTVKDARNLFLTSIIYLPILLVVLVLTKI